MIEKTPEFTDESEKEEQEGNMFKIKPQFIYKVLSFKDNEFDSNFFSPKVELGKSGLILE